MDATEDEANDYHIAVLEDPALVPAAEWNALLAASPMPTPFMRHEYLLALHRSGSAVAESGWTPQFIAVRHSGHLVAAALAYRKSHSYGEYVFDWAWADAYERHGLAYYPKLLSAVPFTPVPGSRLLATSDAGRRQLLRALRALAQRSGLSSAHLLFMDSADATAAQAEGWMLRSGVQFHWTQTAEAPHASFDDMLTSMQRDKRKKIQQDRRKVSEAGVRFTSAVGREITEVQWDYFYRCYVQTYRAHGSTPYLARSFFRDVASALSDHWLLFTAWREGRPVACSLVAIDRNQGVAWGRYWGATEAIPCLHFEACYYQPLKWCIEQRFLRFEGGAQGEHKMARGLLPVNTLSAHWLAHPQFARAIEDFLAREGAGVDAYLDELRERNPFRDGAQSR